MPELSALSSAGAFAVALSAAAAILAVWWLLEATEGAYLGPRAVRWGYDRFAGRYDRRKAFDLAEDVEDLALPLFTRLEAAFGPKARMLDVATGTGRLPVALLTIPWFQGEVVGLDISEPMLDIARKKVNAIGAAERVTLKRDVAAPLPFDDETFEGAALVEALEFLPDRWATLDELKRILRPGGWLLVTNRIGGGAWLMPGRTERTKALEARLRRMGWEDVASSRWTTLYDRVWARKPGGDLDNDSKSARQSGRDAGDDSEWARKPGGDDGDDPESPFKPSGHDGHDPARLSMSLESNRPE